MKIQLPLSPLVMLIHAPEIVDSNAPELAAYEAVCPAMLYFVWVVDVEVMKYESSEGIGVSHTVRINT